MSITYIFIWLLLGLIFGIIEIVAPVKHRFICVTLGADITAVCNCFVDDIIVLSIIFVAVSAISIIGVNIHHYIKGKEKKKACEQESH